MLAIKSPQSYYQQAGLCQQVGDFLLPFATHIRILTSPAAWQAVNPALSQSLESAGIRWQTEMLTGECTADAVATLQQNAAGQGAELILGIGGGRVLDTAKAAGDAGHLPVVTLPTQAATCAAWSPLSILYTPQGGHLRSQPLTRMPVLVLVDSEVIARSDVRYLQAGIVDALAKYYEFRPYLQHNPDSLALSLKIMAAEQALAVFRQYGDAAIAANRQQQVTPALVKVIDANIMLAGLANSVRDTLPTPGYAHAIHNQLTRMPELHAWLHGEKVGYSLRVQSLMENPAQPDAELLTLLQRFGTPLTLAPLNGSRQTAIRTIADGVTFPAACADRLPFAVTADALEQALLATENAF